MYTYMCRLMDTPWNECVDNENILTLDSINCHSLIILNKILFDKTVYSCSFADVHFQIIQTHALIICKWWIEGKIGKKFHYLNHLHL